DQLDLLERPPKMIFDVDTDDGVQQIRVYEGDDCFTLAKQPSCRELLHSEHSANKASRFLVALPTSCKSLHLSMPS
ncbi:hypothetical protein AK812_SmicGene47052, partial [Symbiodinium microadriaticum]